MENKSKLAIKLHNIVANRANLKDKIIPIKEIQDTHNSGSIHESHSDFKSKAFTSLLSFALIASVSTVTFFCYKLFFYEENIYDAPIQIILDKPYKHKISNSYNGRTVKPYKKPDYYRKTSTKIPTGYKVILKNGNILYPSHVETKGDYIIITYLKGIKTTISKTMVKNIEPI